MRSLKVPLSTVFSSCSCFLINTADRIIRVYDGREILTCGRDGEPEPMQKLQDLVNRYAAPLLTRLPSGCGLLKRLFPLQDSVEALLLLRRRRVHRGRLGPAARPLHLGEEHREPGEDPARHPRGAAAGRGGENDKPPLSAPCCSEWFNPVSAALQWHPVRPIIASISSGVVSIWAQNQVVRQTSAAIRSVDSLP